MTRFVLFASIIVSFLLLKFDEIISAQYLWIGLIWICALLGLSLQKNRSSTFRALTLNAAIVVLCLAIVEAVLFFQLREPFEGKVLYSNVPKEGFGTADNVLGYTLNKNAQKIVEYKSKGELVSRTTYTVDRNGLRASTNGTNPEKSVLFFGCSFTYGSRVNDNETMPSKVGAETKGQYGIYNFGVGGYGTHQMLAALEHGLVDRIVGGAPVYVVYQALPDHIPRLLGLRKWDRHGPRYMLDGSAQVRYAGPFDAEKHLLTDALNKQLEKSALYTRLVPIVKSSTISEEDIDLFVAMVERSKQVLERKYPGLDFHVIFWNVGAGGVWHFGNDRSDLVMEKLKTRNIRVHPVSEILPDYEENKLRYEIDKYDGHPSPLAHDLIAQYVVKKILRVE
jgi:hypothetical protein